MNVSFHHSYLFQKMKNKLVPDSIYQKNLALFQTLGTFSLPDFSHVTLPWETCSCMTPQGICATERYIIITAYCNIKRFKKGTEKVHNSCLMVFDKKSHEYKALLELPDKNHVGGIAYDGTYLWIAKSTKNCLSIIREIDLNRTIERLTKSSIKYSVQKNMLSFQNVPSGKISYFQKEIPCGMTASFVTFFKQRIWVGYCAPAGKKGFLRSFQIQKNPHTKKAPVSLAFDKELKIPAKANGASFYENKEKKPDETYLFLSISGGRKKASKMLIYRTNLTKLHLHQTDLFLLPPLLEESCIEKQILYTLYESSSPAYRDVPGNSCPFPVDVVSMTTPELLLK